ncbi:histidine phosphatase family protein [Clostridium sp. MSJ-4]|uniref:Histidine phosphatase family protein n=1 Tax=Clostridium simiarum TaxID=2841506 RepID=A0ABS6F3N2_9CLOT|nr:histidine phosphatase family protein [Clostridium simiarum]MBU5592223.1 histidine phosphatase family protein [Clostridium simiarum]
MKIGLVRHFKVNIQHKRYMNSAEYDEFAERYNVSDVFPKDVDLKNIKWDKCYCSDLSRAMFTAKSIYKGEIKVTDKLREIQVVSRFNTKVPIHYYLWDIIGRLSWLVNHPSQPEGSRQTKDRIEKVLDDIIKESKDEDNILIVSHAALMYCVKNELKRRGFKGEKFFRAENGVLYLFEK